ncbi:MAG: metallophosphoesterase [Candidatus Brocadiia bacterium]
MSESSLLILSDIHYFNLAESNPGETDRECDLGAELVARALRDAQRRSNLDAIVLLGDLVEDGSSDGAIPDLLEIRDNVRQQAPKLPCIVVPGNHDPDAETVLRLFEDEPGIHDINGYLLYTFVDSWDENDVGHRNAEQMARFRNVAEGTNQPLIALQHNPLYPPIESDYPYILDDHISVMSQYAECALAASLSGHYHPGQEPTSVDGVTYWTCPSLSKPPFAYGIARFRGPKVEIQRYALKLPEKYSLFDVHCHTQYAYCADNITAPDAIRRTSLFGLRGLCLSEHADQLYLTRKEHDEAYVYTHPDYWARSRPANCQRLPDYRRYTEPLRTETVKIGLEVEPDLPGRPGAHPDDLEGWDLLLGAVHWIPPSVTSEKAMRSEYLERTRSLLANGCRILAHPFRFFSRNDLPVPRNLYEPVTDLLKEYDAAAEINFHSNQPDPDFFKLCIRKNVRIALGSDSHKCGEVADFHPHIDFLRQITGQDTFQNILFPARDEI